MAIYPLSPVGWLPQQFFDSDGHPLVGGQLFSYVAGTSTPLACYADVDGATAHTNPIILDTEGRPEGGTIYCLPTGYKFILKDVNDVEQWTQDNFEDVGATFVGNFGTVLSEGSKNVTSGYLVLVTDHLVTVDSAGGADPCVITLPPATDATQPVCIKNLGDIDLAVTPDGTDTIDTQLGAYTMPAAVNPMAPSIWLVSDKVSAWYIIASHGLV